MSWDQTLPSPLLVLLMQVINQSYISGIQIHREALCHSTRVVVTYETRDSAVRLQRSELYGETSFQNPRVI